VVFFELFFFVALDARFGAAVGVSIAPAPKGTLSVELREDLVAFLEAKICSFVDGRKPVQREVDSSLARGCE